MKLPGLAFLVGAIGFTHAASISPGGVPAGIIHPSSPQRNRTNFKDIFSIISKNRGRSERSTVDVRTRATTSPPDPTFFQLVFGPATGANDAPGYMGFVSLPEYDVNACAQQCNTRAFDASSGPCIYFNIWSAIVNGTVLDNHICSMYNTVTDQSSATNTGQGSLHVTASRGYSRINLIQDGSFQDFTCIVSSSNSCAAQPSAFWNRIFTVYYDFILVDNLPAHSGTSSALFFLDPPEDGLPFDVPSTLTYIQPLNAVPGKTYILSFFYTPNSFTFPVPNPLDSLLTASWNGVHVLDVLQPVGTTLDQSLTFLNAQVQVTAIGDDFLFFKNGAAVSHQLYLDDIALFEKWF